MKYRRYHHVNAHCLIVDKLAPNRIWIWSVEDGLQLREEVTQWLDTNVGKHWEAWELDTVSSRIYFTQREHAMMFKLTWS